MRNLNLLIRSGSLLTSTLLALTLGIFGTAGIASAAGPSGSAAKPPAPTSDAALIGYLQRHFKIANPALIKLGPASETPIKGMVARPLTVSNEQGQSISTVLFYDQSATHGIVGQYLDLGGEPWGRMDLSQIHLDDRPTLGAAGAPVTIVEFADFECPYCAHAFSVLETMASTTYKGKMKVIFKNYPLNVHPWAIKAAEAAECARLQNPDAFWQFARYFYTNQGAITPQNVQEHIDKLARSQRLDQPSLKACMDSPQTADRIKQDQMDGAVVKVTSTPTFFINGIPVVGLPDNKVVDFVISSELAEKNGLAAH